MSVYLLLKLTALLKQTDVHEQVEVSLAAQAGKVQVQSQVQSPSQKRKRIEVKKCERQCDGLSDQKPQTVRKQCRKQE